MPYFKNNPMLGYTLFTYVGRNVLGRFIGGYLRTNLYFRKNKFNIAMIVNVLICFTNGFVLFMPFTVVLNFDRHYLLLHLIYGFHRLRRMCNQCGSLQWYLSNDDHTWHDHGSIDLGVRWRIL